MSGRWGLVPDETVIEEARQERARAASELATTSARLRALESELRWLRRAAAALASFLLTAFLCAVLLWGP